MSCFLKALCRACWELIVKCKKASLLVFHDSAWVHRRVSMTVREIKREGETQAVTLKEDAIQLDNDSVYLHGGLSAQPNRSHVCNLSVCLPFCQSVCAFICLSPLPAVWPRQQISSKCGDWQAVAGSWEHTLLIRHVAIQEYRIPEWINGNDTHLHWPSFIHLAFGLHIV